jgi:hypothetical protein
LSVGCWLVVGCRLGRQWQSLVVVDGVCDCRWQQMADGDGCLVGCAVVGQSVGSGALLVGWRVAPSLIIIN